MNKLIMYISYYNNSMSFLHDALRGIEVPLTPNAPEIRNRTIARYLPFQTMCMHYFVHSGIVLLGYSERRAGIDSLNLLLLRRGRCLVWSGPDNIVYNGASSAEARQRAAPSGISRRDSRSG